MSEKIEITRERLREASALASDKCKNGDPPSMTWFERLERELFGPKKPREFYISVENDGMIKHGAEIVPGNIPPSLFVHVREVLDDK